MYKNGKNSAKIFLNFSPTKVFHVNVAFESYQSSQILKSSNYSFVPFGRVIWTFFYVLVAQTSTGQAGSKFKKVHQRIWKNNSSSIKKSKSATSPKIALFTEFRAVYILIYRFSIGLCTLFHHGVMLYGQLPYSFIQSIPCIIYLSLYTLPTFWYILTLQ